MLCCEPHTLAHGKALTVTTRLAAARSTRRLTLSRDPTRVARGFHVCRTQRCVRHTFVEYCRVLSRSCVKRAYWTQVSLCYNLHTVYRLAFHERCRELITIIAA